ncbi:hypothetical protein D3C73_1639620 [compost metagenome]
MIEMRMCQHDRLNGKPLHCTNQRSRIHSGINNKRTLGVIPLQEVSIGLQRAQREATNR